MRERFSSSRIKAGIRTAAAICLGLLLASCGGGSSNTSTSSTLSGNWLITLTRQTNPVPLLYSGFLIQSGKNVTGSLILGDGCSGVGPVTGTVNGQSLQLDINEFGQNLTLTGTIPSAGTTGVFIGGGFSTLSGGCTDASTGVWSAQQVAPINGTFHGTLVSGQSPSNGTVNVTGSFTQGSNIGASNASLTGTMTTSGTPPFCSYVTNASISGIISGTTASLTFYDPLGNRLNNLPLVVAVTPDGTSISGAYGFQAISKSCTGDIGTMQLTFP
jgi:hypothetical protein